ncbi:MAG: glycerol-3-phosphate 1-O-acyltransferase PlsY [Nitrospinota bacterium]
MDWLLTVLAFLLGSIPFGWIVARTRGVDIRSVGSGNIGATNVGRALGKREGALTLSCDVGKGLLPVLAARWAGLDPGWVATVCLAAVLGHIYSPWLRFRGGKGVATAGGAFLAGAPLAIVLAAVGFLVALGWSRRVSAGSLASAVVLPTSVWALGYGPQMSAASGIAALLIILRHKDNLRRLLSGTEPKIGASRAPPGEGGEAGQGGPDRT